MTSKLSKKLTTFYTKHTNNISLMYDPVETDLQFEIQYIVSLTLVVLGLLTAPIVGNYLIEVYGFILLIVISIHVVVYNIYYIFNNVSKYSYSFVEKLFGLNRLTMWSVNFVFIFVVTHLVISSVSSIFISCMRLPPASIILPVRHVNQTTCYIMEVIINSLFPLLFTVVIFAIPIRKWMDSMVVAGGISLIYEPEHLTIFYSFSDTEPILVKLENRTKEKQKFDLQINFPDEVQWKNNNDIHKGTYEESVTVPSNEQRRFDFLVRYRGNDKQADQIAIKAIHDEFSTEEIISVIKDPS